MDKQRDCEKFECNGKTYHYINGDFYDETYVLLPRGEKSGVERCFFTRILLPNMTASETIQYLHRLKETEYSHYLEEIFEFAYKKFDTNNFFIKKSLAMYTSLLRAKRQPNKAITIALRYLCPAIYSVPLFTSLSAAFCDIGNFRQALAFANKAYALQGGSVGFTNELSMVYKRIRKLTSQRKNQKPWFNPKGFKSEFKDIPHSRDIMFDIIPAEDCLLPFKNNKNIIKKAKKKYPSIAQDNLFLLYRKQKNTK